MKDPATSYVAATFHPTVGQHAHQSISNAATPELVMIPQGLRVNCRFPHNQVDTISNHTQQGLTGPQQLAKPAQSEDQPRPTVATQSLHSPVKKEKQPRIIPNKQ